MICLIRTFFYLVLLCSCHPVLGTKRIGEPCMHHSECYKGLRCQKFCQLPEYIPYRDQKQKLSIHEKNDKCPPGWFDYNNNCYYVSRYRRTWVKARQDCQMKGAELLVIDSDIVLDFSIDFFTKLKLSNSYFVGARANGLSSNWEWLNGKKIPASGFMWSECGSPSNSGGTNLIIVEGCASLNFYGLNDITCDSQQYFICSKFKSSEQNQAIKISHQKLLQGALRGLKKCRYDYHCIKGLICTQNRTCGCPDGFSLPPNFDKCVNKNESDFMEYIASYDHLDFFVSNFELTWRTALGNAMKFECNFLMLENSLQLINFINLIIRNNLSGTYWIGVFSLNRTATWIDCSPIPNGPWFPSFNGCSSQMIESGLVCFALEKYKIVIKNCADNYKALYVKGVKSDELQIELLMKKLITTTSTSTVTASSDSSIINPPGCGRRIEEIRNERLGKIVNGQRADPEDWGWQSLLEYRGIFICGGSIINSEWVISAAHCFLPNNTASDFTLKFGLHDQLNPEQYSVSRSVIYFVIHPSYNPNTFENDIALIRINSPLIFTDQILPVCIPDYSESFAKKESWTTGWGALFQQATEPSRYLMEVKLSILNDFQCERKYFESFNFSINTAVFLCGRNNLKGPCFGDSGGPLVVKSQNRWELAGITSWGLFCGDGAVFTRTSFYIDWILETISGLTSKHKSSTSIISTTSLTSSSATTNFASSINQPECGRRPSPNNLFGQIVGGKRANPKDWGWQVAMNYQGFGFLCGGSILNTMWIITAAHCVEFDLDPDFYSIDIGLHDREGIEPWVVNKKVNKIIIHPNYNSDTLDNDIALLMLDNPLTFTDKIYPICIPDESFDFQNKYSWATGWGALFWTGPVSRYLMQVKLLILSDEKCEKKFNNTKTTSVICAGETGTNKDTCQGDSGGPLVVEIKGKWLLAGITSWGFECGDGGVYTKTSFYFHWIKNMIENN